MRRSGKAACRDTLKPPNPSPSIKKRKRAESDTVVAQDDYQSGNLRGPCTKFSRTTDWRNRKYASDIRGHFPTISKKAGRERGERTYIKVESDSDDSDIKIISTSPLVGLSEPLEGGDKFPEPPGQDIEGEHDAGTTEGRVSSLRSWPLLVI